MKRINGVLYIANDCPHKETRRVGRIYPIPLPVLFSSPDLLSVAAHCHFRAGRKINVRNIPESIPPSLFTPNSQIVFLRAEVVHGRDHFRNQATEPRFAPKYCAKSPKLKGTRLDRTHDSRDTHFAEEHCCLWYDRLSIVCDTVDRRRKSNTVESKR